MERLVTGIENFDEVLGGGIPLYSVNIIAGNPGSGKTILVQNILFNAARRGLKSLYFTTISESQFKMVRNLANFKFFDNSFLGEQIIYRDLGLILKKEGLSGAFATIDDLMKKFRPDILVIDSFKALRSLVDSEKEFRAMVFELASKLAVWETTAFLVGEYIEEELSTLSEFAIADGIIYLYGQQERKFQKRYLRILKMRGTGTIPGEHIFLIDKDGIKLYPRMLLSQEELVYDVEKGLGLEVRDSFGIEGLDNLLGGGIYRGSSTLLVGATGTGKTLLSLKFALEAAQKGEKALYISYEETPEQIISLAEGIGFKEIRQRIREGSLILKFYSPVEIDVDIHAYEILEYVKKYNIKRLVLDTVSSLETTIGNNQKYRDILWSLTQNLKRRKITTIYTFETLNLNLFNTFNVTDLGISLLADNIIFMRYYEEDAEIKRAIGVLKTRRSNHEKGIYQYVIESSGVSILGKIKSVLMK